MVPGAFISVVAISVKGATCGSANGEVGTTVFSTKIFCAGVSIVTIRIQETACRVGIHHMNAPSILTGVYSAAVSVIAVLFFYATTWLIQIERKLAPFNGVTHIHSANQIIKAAHRVVNTFSQFVIE